VKRCPRRCDRGEVRAERPGVPAAETAVDQLSHSEDGAASCRLAAESKQEEMMPRKRNPEQEAAAGHEEQVVSAATRASDLWIETQTSIFEEFDEVARRWLDRRREALDATRQSFAEFRNDNSLGGVMRVQQEWVIASMNRLAADMAELSGAVLNIAQAMASRIGRIGEAATRDVEQTGQELMSGAGSKPGIPAAK
jgi:hypothetical protein